MKSPVVRPDRKTMIALAFWCVSATVATAATCDVTLAVEPNKGRADEAVLSKVKAWLEGHKTLVASVEEARFDDGFRKLCIMASEPATPDQLFESLQAQLPKSTKAGWVRLYSSTGQSVRLAESNYDPRGGGSSAGSHPPPKNNGLPQRPPSDK
jgi:hypothetical protein